MAILKDERYLTIGMGLGVRRSGLPSAPSLLGPYSEPGPSYQREFPRSANGHPIPQTGKPGICITNSIRVWLTGSRW